MEQEYIKGDIVMYNNKIHTIMDTLGVNNYELSYISHPVHQLELSGVPLTPEILEKNGWDSIGYNIDFNGNMLNICSKRDILPDLYYYYATKSFLVSICGKIVLSNIKYIHELQHFLFGLGLNSEMEVQIWVRILNYQTKNWNYS